MPAPAYDGRIFVHGKTEGALNNHIKEWQNCEACCLCEKRKHVVLYRGYLPCDVLFIGEAPGKDEDTMGYPFIGAAGQLLTTLTDRTCELAGRYRARPQPPIADLFKGAPNGVLAFGFTNIVACIPFKPPDADGVQYSSPDIRAPKKEEAAACQRRLTQIITLANPRLICTLGDVAKRFLPTDILCHTVEHPRAIYGTGNRQSTDGMATVINLIHPAAILRTEQDDPRRASLMEKRFVINLSEALQKL